MKFSLTRLEDTAHSALRKVGQVIHRDLQLLTPLQGLEITAIVLFVVQFMLMSYNGIHIDAPIMGLKLEGERIGHVRGQAYESQVAQLVQAREDTQFTLKIANYETKATIRQMGMTIDLKKADAMALAAGRDSAMLRNIINQNRALVGLYEVSLSGLVQVDRPLFTAYMDTLDKKVATAPQSASFIYKDGAVQIVPDTFGKAINRAAAEKAIIAADPQRGRIVSLPTASMAAPVQSGMLKTILPSVQQITARPLVISADNKQITLSPEQLLGIVVPKITPSTDPRTAAKVEVSYDETKLASYINDVTTQSTLNPVSKVVRDGQVVVEGNNGRKVKDDTAMTTVLAALIGRQTGQRSSDSVALEMVDVPAPVVHQSTRSASTSTRTGSGKVRLTFDDGPGAHTEQVLNILNRYNVHATFYVVGRNAQNYPGSVARMCQEGHAVGNHSYNHADLSRLSYSGVQQEIESTQNVVRNICGFTPTGFRPPYGAVNQNVREVAGALGVSIDMWSVDPQDWAPQGGAALTRRVLQDTGTGSVVLLHVLYQQTVDALPHIIEGLRAEGYTLE